MALKPAEGFGTEPVVGEVVVDSKRARKYEMTTRFQECKKPLYAICFNLIDARFYRVFASAGGNKVTVYQCLPEGGALAVLQTYVDEDKEEEFYTVSWAVGKDGSPLLACSGSKGVVRVVDCESETLQRSFVGHGGSVNELRTQSLKPCLVASASKDESIRLWNVDTGVCVLVFAGAGGHRNEVLSVDFHGSDILQMASCGMDGSIKIWSLRDYWKFVEMSFTWTDSVSKFPTKHVQFPMLTALVHNNYVDCTRWLGDLILSKSVDHEIVLWEPLQYKVAGSTENEGKVDVLQKYPVPDCDIWFIKFSCDMHFENLAIGNREGRVFVWEVQSSPPKLIAKLSHPQCRSPIRQTATAHDGSTIMCCCEDGSICRWDAV
ncbi:hypothetical protein M758_12G029000 [Ceratodon purpureus]|uniref:Fertilization-independent endosperm protein n=1 Tax=Ceratodon purpureus TaxID=3225 RepID=A0A8T0G8Q8_CERPU|nr:hypothetical protein KC19_12G029100 [Ceratodon purpureus]KAG0597897.1 hypothetical protein M758_12G029000 [Ceratodon purpureus]